MKKILLAVICLMVAALGIGMTGCGSSDNTYDAGHISCTVPEGWKVFTAEDITKAAESAESEADDDAEDVSDEAEEEAEDVSDDDLKDPDSIYLYKGAEKASDIFTANGITISYQEYGLLGSFDDMKGYYNNVQEKDPLKLSNYEWEYFTGEMLDQYKYAIMMAEADGDAVIQVNVVLKNKDNTISLEDEDVKAILESIKITGSSSSDEDVSDQDDDKDDSDDNDVSDDKDDSSDKDDSNDEKTDD